MKRPQILIIEDDNAIGNLISTTLETQHYQYRRAKNGASGVLEAASCRPDVILLDLGLPDMDGVDIIKKVRTWSNTPIIVYAARSEDHDKVEALDAGADDYLTKPFSVRSCWPGCGCPCAGCATPQLMQTRRPASTRTAG